LVDRFVDLGIAADAQTLAGGVTDLFNKVSITLTRVTMPTL